MKERIVFLKNFIKNPRQIGSITPSSRFLTKAMIETIDFEKAETIVELGAGVGCFSKEINNKITNKTNYFIFEKNKEMRDILHQKFGDVKIFEKAEELNTHIQKGEISTIDFIISGLPFTSLEKKLRETILQQVYDGLKQEGKFITFQYSLHLLNYFKNQYQKVEIKFVPLNVFPAFVYICTK